MTGNRQRKGAHVKSAYEISREFADLFAAYERALKRGGFLRQDRREAQADWKAFATALGNEFYDEVRASNLADTLIGKPPAKLMREGLEWKRQECALGNSVELIEQGVCRVRNSLFHGEKFIGNADEIGRDFVLVMEALAVLRAAKGKIPSVTKRLGKQCDPDNFV
jgi:hypothetical protein